MSKTSPPRLYAIQKRILDVTVSVSVLALGAPVWLLIAAVIKLSNRGPVLYSGTRVGRGGRPFQMHKFRTMVMNADKMGGPSTACDDQRITRIGIVLRRTKIDEIPQLVNVLRGQLSLVGPRPQVPQDVARYTFEERRLLAIRPGITDWASITFRHEGEILRGQGDADEAYDRLVRPEKMRLGLLYVDHASFRTDLQILRQTVFALIGRDVRVSSG